VLGSLGSVGSGAPCAFSPLPLLALTGLPGAQQLVLEPIAAPGAPRTPQPPVS